MARHTKTQILNDIHTYNINLASREIYIHSYYAKDEDNEPGIDYRSSTTFIKNLHILDSYAEKKPILIHMQSEGGCWQNGMAMHNAIHGAECYITILAYSQASSMSGIILQAPELRLMMPDCHFLMHHGDVGYGGHPMAAKEMADFDHKSCHRMLQIFATRAWDVGPFFKKKKGSTLDTAYKFFEKKLKDKVDWILTAEEAVFYGLADDVFGSKDYPNMSSLLKGE